MNNELHEVKAENLNVNTMMISPRQFIDWYRKADLELIVGVGDQEIRSNTDLWKGLKAYIHQYSLRPDGLSNLYWDIERNRFNPKNELFQIKKQLFKNHYALFQSVILQKTMNASGVNGLKLQKHAIVQMAIKLNGLVDYLNSAAFIRKKIIKTIEFDNKFIEDTKKIYQRDYDKYGIIPPDHSDSEADKRFSRRDPLRNLLMAIDDPSIVEMPACIAPSYITECYRKVMIGRNI